MWLAGEGLPELLKVAASAVGVAVLEVVTLVVVLELANVKADKAWPVASGIVVANSLLFTLLETERDATFYLD